MGRFFIHALVLSCIILLSSCNANDDSRSDQKEDEKHFGNFQHQRLSPLARFPAQLLQLLPGSSLDNHILPDGDGIYGVEEPVASSFLHDDDEDYAEDAEFDTDPELQSSLPYGIQNVRRNVEMLPSRSIRTKGKITRTSFQSLCPSRRTLVYLNGEAGNYEYKPDHYEEVTCSHPFTSFRDYRVHRNKPALSRLIDGNMDEICGEVGFSCIQLNRTIFLTRRLFGTDCWESLTRQVPAGCECMWPKHHYGDITSHH